MVRRLKSFKSSPLTDGKMPISATFSPMEARLESIIQYIRSLVKESDRGCVLLVVAHLDASLGTLHRTYIESIDSWPESFMNDLFGRFGPLGSFGGKIQLARA